MSKEIQEANKNDQKKEETKSLDSFFEEQPKVVRKVYVVGKTCESCEG